MGRGPGEKHIPDARMKDGVLAPGRKDGPGKGDGLHRNRAETKGKDWASRRGPIPRGNRRSPGSCAMEDVSERGREELRAMP